MGQHPWDTNLQPHIISTALTNSITNGGWQHVALTFDTNSETAILYTNGQLAVTTQFPTSFVPRTYADFYLGYDPTVQPIPLSFANFNSTAGMSLQGTATTVGGALCLTFASAATIGPAWAVNKQKCAAGFDTDIWHPASANPGAGEGTLPGADGFSFTLQQIGPGNPNWYAPTGPPEGSISVFYNTFLNWPGCTDYTTCDVSDNSVGVVSNGVYLAQTDLYPFGINLKDGAAHSSRITFDGGGLTVFVDGQKVLSNVSVPGVASAVDSAGMAWVGFDAGTGFGWENHDILSWTFRAATPGNAFAGGLDEFSLYNRALSPCEVSAIYHAGSRGKYGTNVLVCPVESEVTLITSGGPQVFQFTNGLSWITNGPFWETNTHQVLHRFHQRADSHHRARRGSLWLRDQQQRRQQSKCRRG